jgi:hypothetical protein
MIGFGMDGEVMGGEGNIADAMAGTPGAMDGATGYGGLGEISGGPGLSTAQTNAAPTMNVVPDQPISPQITSFTDALKAAMNFSFAQQGLKSFMSIMPEQMRAPTMNMNLDQLAAGVQAMGPGFELGPDLISSSFNGQMSVPMSGSGAHLGIASNIANVGGKNVHMGPGMTMNEDFFPGYGTNPFSGDAMADPSDPYIRKKRGTEIAAMIGP